jgi:hypothetical protein
MADSPRNEKPTQVTSVPSGDVPAHVAELPVVARLIVEVRSDGSRTVARGAMEDAASGTKAAIEASGSTPLELALTLARSIFSAPWFARPLARGALKALMRKL